MQPHVVGHIHAAIHLVRDTRFISRAMFQKWMELTTGATSQKCNRGVEKKKESISTFSTLL